MPTYEYQCFQCQHRFELRQGFSDPAEAACPQCGGNAKRRISAPAVVFKGSGWYRNDTRNAVLATRDPDYVQPGMTRGDQSAQPAASDSAPPGPPAPPAPPTPPAAAGE